MFRWFVAIWTLSFGLIQPLLAAGELSEEELRMKECLISLSEGEGTIADLQIELIDGSPMQATGSRTYTIANSKIVSQEWDSPGAAEKRNERAVADDEVRNLLRELVEKEYWRFKGTRRSPDLEEFMFRFHYKNLEPVEYRCQAHEYQQSQPLSAIRSVLLDFVSGFSPESKR